MNISAMQVTYVADNVRGVTPLVNRLIRNVTDDQINSGPSLLMLTAHAYGVIAHLGRGCVPSVRFGVAAFAA